MGYYMDYDDDDDEDVIIEVAPDDGYYHRNAVRVKSRQSAQRVNRGWYDRRAQARRRSGPVVVRHQPRPQPRPQQIVVQQPPAQSPAPTHSDSGLMVGGVRVSLGALAGTMLTLGGLGVQLASHFVDKPTPPSGEVETGHLVEFQEKKDKSERKVHVLESIGRALSDLGQLTAFKSNA